MATPTYDPIASTTLTSSVSSVTFSSLDTIAAGYRDLVLVVNVGGTTSNYAYVRFNGDTGSNYNWVRMMGNGSTTSSYNLANTTSLEFFGYTTSISGMGIMQIFDFAETNKHKSTLSSWDRAAESTRRHAGRWASTSAITSITITAAGGSFIANSTFSLYGIAA